MVDYSVRRNDPNVLVHCDQPELVLDLIQKVIPDNRIAVCRSYDALAEEAVRTQPDVVLSYKFEPRPYPAAAIKDLGSVKWIHVGGAGCDHLMPWDPDRLTVTNASGTQGEVMAEYALCAVYAFNLSIPRFLEQQRERFWKKRQLRVTAGGTLGIVGCGRNGRMIAERARAVGLRTLGVRTRVEPVPGFDAVYATSDLASVLSECDYVVVVVPLTDQTRNLVDQTIIEAMKPGTIFVNVSRGGVVDEAALEAALRSGHLAGAVLDVFEKEPLPEDHPFWSLENIILTPHTAAEFSGWQRAAAEVFCRNLERWMAGAPLENVVDPDRGY